MTIQTSKPECRFAGFTLIELLVIIAIIGILASLLLPALSRANTKAYRVACMSQQKTWGIATFMYLSDNNSCYPVVASAPHNPWYSLIGKQTGMGTMPTEGRLLNQYVGNTEEASRCPDDRGQASTFADWENGSGLSVYDQLGFSYGFAQTGTIYGVKPLVMHNNSNPVRMSQLNGPLGNKLLLSEWNWYANRPWAIPINRWHSYGSEYGSGRQSVTTFADGHSEYFAFPNNWETRSYGYPVDPAGELW